RDARALAGLRQSTNIPIASLETVLGRQSLRPFLEAEAVDVAIIDRQWSGMTEALKMAAAAEIHEGSVASHNYHGPLSTLMGAHFSASIPNNRIVELVVDEAPWIQDFLSAPLKIEDGELILPDTPGWGADIIEEAVRQHPAAYP